MTKQPTSEPDHIEAMEELPRQPRPFIAIVGRPNVGKSTLYNRLTRSRDAIVDDKPGITRDRMVGIGRIGQSPYWIVDTGGIESDESDLHHLMKIQVDAALEECEAVIYIVDGRDGVTTVDDQIARQLRSNKDLPVFLAVNKVEGLEKSVVTAEFYQLGLGEPTPVSGKNGDGVVILMNTILEEISHRKIKNKTGEIDSQNPLISIIGRPNVGKSTLVNSIAGEERVVVFDMPGTTRDSIDVPVKLGGKNYTLVDTAGMRKKSRIDDRIERFSVMKSVKAIERSQIVLVMLDARDGVVEQDSRLISLVLNSGRSMIMLVNKWDDMSDYDRERAKISLDVKLRHLSNVPTLYISAKNKKGYKELPKLIDKVYDSAMVDMGTGELNRILKAATIKRTPPMSGIRSIKLKFAHQGGVNPPHIIIHGNMLDKLPHTYLRYLSNTFEDEFNLVGTRVRLSFKISDNPYDTPSEKK
ncbi:MAG: ribosome biogenesis GTPase Der [Arenicella sp.]